MMLRLCARVIAFAVMLVGPIAQAADTTLTLACQGTETMDDAKPKPISMGIIVNFPARTVQGFGLTPVKIIGINDVTIFFDNEPLAPTSSAP